MRVDLPKAKASYDAADILKVAAGTHSMARTAAGFNSPDLRFTIPHMFDPARRGMGDQWTSRDGTGIDLLKFDEDANTRQQVLQAVRNIEKTHPMVSAIIEIYSRYPLAGIKLSHGDKGMQDFYEDLFLRDLDFGEFLVDVGKAYWTDGMAFAYGNWNDSLGLWVGEDLLDPADMYIERVPLLGDEIYYMVPSQSLREIANGRDAASAIFREKMPEVWDAVRKGQDIVIDKSRLTYIADKSRRSELYGTPRMLRCWNTLRLESRMNSAMQATADRLYAPLVMFTVGGTMPNGDRFIPSASMLDAFRDNLDAALSSDFRMLVTHDGVKAQQVISGDRMQNFKSDWDMYDDRILLAWGLTTSFLKPESQSFATSALDFKLVSQLMENYQKKLKRVYDNQAMMVAEAQGHYRHDEGTNDVVYELREVWDQDENDGQGGYVVKECPCLDYPELKFSPLDFSDKQRRREFLLQLREKGVPISTEDMMVDVQIDLDESRRRFNEETVQAKVDEADRQARILNATLNQSIPVPPDTKAYMEKGIVPARFKKLVEAFPDVDEGALNAMLNPGKATGRGTGSGTKQTPLESETGVRGAPEESSSYHDL